MGLFPRLVLAALLAVAATAFPARAGERAPASDWAETEQTAVRLIVGTTTLGDGAAVPLGLQFRLAPGWKIYWRSPGDAGYPPRVDWSNSDNLAKARVHWPAPERFSVSGIETLGYRNAVVLPVIAWPNDPMRPLVMHAEIDYMTCKDICIPYRARLTLDLPPGPADPSAFTHLLARFQARVPGDGAAHGLAIEGLAIGKNDTLVVRARSGTPFEQPDLFLEGSRELTFGHPRITLSEGGHALAARVPVDGLEYLELPLAETPITVTLADGERNAERRFLPGGGETFPDHGPETALLTMLGLALLGGFILNLMPCVLPVLSLKLVGVIEHGGRARAAVRRGFLASAAGIVFSFLLLAGVLAALKAAGGAVGWGIQFQQPWFLIAMALVITLFAANLWNLFEIRLPTRLAGLGHTLGNGEGLGGHFLAGVFATLLATPCSAPFLGTAVAFALARGTGEIAAIFGALAIGFAAPYLAVAAWPDLARLLPRPGSWMVWLRRILGLALAGTALWILMVLASAHGFPGALLAGCVLLAIVGLLAFRRLSAPRFGRTGTAGVLLLAAGAFALPALTGGVPDGRDETSALDMLWQPFEEAAIPPLVAEGQVVFVDVTAEWCVTCKVNKALVIGSEAVMARLAASGVVALQADWTRPDPAISRYLARNGRYGIPFNAVYGPGAPQGILLPELLGESTVLDALDRAAGGEKKAAR